jgi:peptidoglycan/LPS O-acetylase OafA/YrhL
VNKAGGYRPESDGLRALAVLPVVLFHAGVPGFPGGFVGVDVFFVISGFLITRIIHSELAEGRFSITGFYERRARRILPALSVVLVAATGVAAILMSPTDLIRYGKSLAATVLFASNIWFWNKSGGYFALVQVHRLTDASARPRVARMRSAAARRPVPWKSPDRRPRAHPGQGSSDRRR